MVSTTGEQTLEVIDCLGAGGQLAQGLTTLSGIAGAAVILLDLSTEVEDPARYWVRDGSVSVIEALARLSQSPTGEGQRPVTILVWEPDGLADAGRARRAAAEATFEAARGIAQTATLEESTQAFRVNVVRGGPQEEDDTRRTVAFLSSGDAGFVIGSTFDLRSRA